MRSTTFITAVTTVLATANAQVCPLVWTEIGLSLQEA